MISRVVCELQLGSMHGSEVWHTIDAALNEFTGTFLLSSFFQDVE
jgi:hypothetical protein